MGINVALDGPSGAGKSTIAKAVAKKLEYVYVDTGAMYRSIAYYVISKGADLSDPEQIKPLLGEISIKLCYTEAGQRVMLNDEDVSDKIRTPEISMGASKVSAIPEVREFLLELQKNIAKENNIIMDGRDIGTTILPNAEVKIYLTASADTRAKRRALEYEQKGESFDLDQIRKDIIERDERDMNREISPLKQAEDAVLVDSSEMGIDDVVNAILNVYKEEGLFYESKSSRNSSLLLRRQTCSEQSLRTHRHRTETYFHSGPDHPQRRRSSGSGSSWRPCYRRSRPGFPG